MEILYLLYSSMSGTQIKLGSTLMDVIPPNSDEFQLRKLLYHRLKRKDTILRHIILRHTILCHIHKKQEPSGVRKMCWAQTLNTYKAKPNACYKNLILFILYTIKQNISGNGWLFVGRWRDR